MSKRKHLILILLIIIFGNSITVPNLDKRSLATPKSYGKHFVAYSGSSYTVGLGQPDTYLGTNWYNGTDISVDRGGVHFNSGVQNKMFHVLSHGAANTNDNNDYYYVVGIGLDDAAKIAYLAMTTLMSTSQYTDSRMAWIQASINIFGYCSQQHKSTVDAWYAVGIGAHSTCPNLSIEESNPSINIYPNPANSVFSISTLGMNLTKNVEIYSISGNLVKTILPNDIIKVDISDLSAGAYIVKANINDKIISKKIIIQSSE